MITIGQLAKCSGISEKALRLYEKKGLIHSVRNNDNNYRYYAESEKETIEKIILFKFLGFSLEQISIFLENEKEMSMEESLRQQRWLLEQQRKRLDTIIYCIDRAIIDCKQKNIDMDKLLENIQAIRIDRSADVQIAELYKHSEKAQDWNCWVFDQAEMKENLTILDAGAGWGNLWRLNQERMPDNCKVTCIDKHNTWADNFEILVEEETRKGNYKEDTFSFLWGDMEEMEIQDKYDRIFLNHVAYFLKDSRKMYEKLCDCLRDDGIFISTLGGAVYYDEAEKLLIDFAKGLESGREKFVREIQNFSENKKHKIWEQMKYIQEIFPKAEKRVFEIELTFDEKDCYEFLLRTYKGVKSELEKNEQALLKYLRKVKEDKGDILLKKDTYLWYCRK